MSTALRGEMLAVLLEGLFRHVQLVEGAAAGIAGALQAEFFVEDARALEAGRVGGDRFKDVRATAEDLKQKRLAPGVHQPEFRHAGGEVGDGQAPGCLSFPSCR